jgi:hypothetical protein
MSSGITLQRESVLRVIVVMVTDEVMLLPSRAVARANDCGCQGQWHVRTTVDVLFSDGQWISRQALRALRDLVRASGNHGDGCLPSLALTASTSHA